MKVFLSGVSSEFGTVRREIASDLRAQGHKVYEQDDFTSGTEAGASGTLLEKLRDTIATCDLVVCLVGDRAGWFPTALEAAPFAPFLQPYGLAEASYTQWEQIFAQKHKAKRSFHRAGAAWSPDRAADEAEARTEKQARFRAAVIERPGVFAPPFETADALRADVLRNQGIVRLDRAQPRNLPLGSIGTLFKGREHDMKALSERLGGAEPLAADAPARATAIVDRAVVHGLGGIGKTRLAIEHALVTEADYSALLFLPAESPEALTGGLLALAGAAVLNLPEAQGVGADNAIAQVLRWLADNPGWFLLIDNADSPAAQTAVCDLIGKLRGGRVVVTSRMANDWPQGFETLGLDILSQAAATDYLLEATPRRRPGASESEDRTEAVALAERLGHLSLALAQAGAYIDKRAKSFTEYRQLWENQRDVINARYGPSDILKLGYPLSVAATWETSVAQLSEDGRRLLDRLAFLSTEPIPREVVEAAPNEEAVDLGEALIELITFSLASWSNTKDAITLHRLVQEVARDRLGSGDERNRALDESIGLIVAALPEESAGDVRCWPRLDPLVPHGLTLFGHAGERAIPGLTPLLNDVATLFEARARYAAAEPLFRRALKIDEAAYGPDHPEVATDLNNLANLLRATNRIAEAEPLYRRVLKIFEAAFGLEHPNVATAANNLASLLDATNRRAEAEPLYRRALTIDEAAYGPDHPTVARRLNNLAGLLRATNRIVEAEPLYRHALKIDEAVYGPDHPTVATRLNNLAGLLRATNRIAEAEPLYRRALKIDEAAYGPDHAEVATDLNNLAGLLNATNRSAEAEPLCRRVLKIFEAAFGLEHPNVATAANNLAGLLDATNRRAEAEPLYRRALKIDEAAYGPDHPNVAIRLNNLAGLLRATNRIAEAEPIYRRVLKIDEAAYGPDHPTVARDLNNLAGLLDATNRSAEAEPLYRRMLLIFLKTTAASGHEHPHLRVAVGNYAGALDALGRDGEAIGATIGTLFVEAKLDPAPFYARWTAPDD